MEYTKQTWTAPTGTGLSRYAKSGESASHVTLTLDPVNLTNTPTPFTMARMAHMEEGIAKAYDTAPPTPWAQYSGKDIPQLPDNVAGTTYKRDNDWVDTDGWVIGHVSVTLSVEDETLKVAYDGTRPDSGITLFKSLDTTGKLIKGHIKCTVPIINVQYYNGTAYVPLILATPNAYETDFYGYIQTTSTSIIVSINHGQITAKTCWLSQLYIGTGAYDRLVFDNSYHYRHLLNNAVVPTPQGLYFNGATSYLRSKDKVTLPDVFTFSATVNCAIGSSQMLFAQGIASTPIIPFILVYRRPNTDSLVIQVSNGTAAFDALVANNFFTGLDNTDIKIEVSINFTNKTVKVYRNNVQFLTTASVPTMLKPVTDNIYFGDFVNRSSKLLGYMRNICLYDTALTDTQRNWLAQGNTPPILYDVTNYETEGYVSIQDADGTNTGVAVSVDSNGNRILKLPATIKASITGKASTSDKWKTARNITISDADGTNTGTAVSVDGSENETLKLPATIKANVTGNADTATKLATARKINGVLFNGSTDITVADDTKAPTSHASSATTYGVSSEANYGHAKASTVAGSANGVASKGTTPAVFAQSNHVHPYEIETLRRSANFTLGTYADGKKLRIANTHASNTITCTLPSGQTMNGQTSFTIAPDTLLEFELIGTAWLCVSKEWEILWENPSKSSPFDAQQITMSAVKEQFKRLVFVYCPYVEYAQIQTKEIPASATETELFHVTIGSAVQPQPAAQRCRGVYNITGNTVNFNLGFTTVTNNSVIIPQEIYGIK